MALKTVKYITDRVLPCCKGPIIICVNAAVTEDSAPFITAELKEVTYYIAGVKKLYRNLIEYDDTQLRASYVQLRQCDINGVLCRDCLFDYVNFRVSQASNDPILPFDTYSVNLSVFGSNQHSIQADVNISADLGNLLELRTDGLYVLASAIPNRHTECPSSYFIGESP